MKRTKYLAVSTIALALSLSSMGMQSNAKELSPTPSYLNVAIIDVQKIVDRSPEISALNTSRKNDMDALIKFVENAKVAIAKETNEVQRKTLEESYNKELNIRKINLDKEYSQKLAEYDKNITTLINKKAKSLGYGLVLTKTCVINGGKDITDDVIKEFK